MNIGKLNRVNEKQANKLLYKLFDVVLGSLIFVMFFNKIIIYSFDNDYQWRRLESGEILLLKISFHCITNKLPIFRILFYEENF